MSASSPAETPNASRAEQRPEVEHRLDAVVHCLGEGVIEVHVGLGVLISMLIASRIDPTLRRARRPGRGDPAAARRAQARR
jgi:hypothetical protein